MSFKREGDDKSLLNNLRRRRIRDLFAEDIPKDEAKLLCNGKYACLVCGYKPVFDTVDMLTVHRRGKKHCAYEAEFLRKKKELADLVRKRQHEQYLKAGTTHIQQAQSSVLLGISSTQPYDPRVKRHKLKPYDRKPRVELNSSHQELQGPDLAMQLTPPGVNLMRHSHQLKNIFKQPQPQEQPPAQPYLKKRKQQFDSTAGEEKQNIPHCTKQPFNTDNNFPQLLPKVRAENEMFDGLRGLRNVGINSFKCAHVLNAEKVFAASFFVNGGGCHTGKIRNSPKLLNFVSNSGISSDTVTHLSNASSDVMSDVGNSIHSPGIITNSPLPSNFVNNSVNVHGPVITTSNFVSDSSFHKSGIVTSDNGAGACVQSGTGVGRSKLDISSQDKKNRAEKYLSLRGSGWKRDWDGKWIRDEDAEFDSDEEPPDLQ